VILFILLLVAAGVTWAVMSNSHSETAKKLVAAELKLNGYVVAEEESARKVRDKAVQNEALRVQIEEMEILLDRKPKVVTDIRWRTGDPIEVPVEKLVEVDKIVEFCPGTWPGEPLPPVKFSIGGAQANLVTREGVWVAIGTVNLYKVIDPEDPSQDELLGYAEWDADATEFSVTKGLAQKTRKTMFALSLGMAFEDEFVSLDQGYGFVQSNSTWEAGAYVWPIKKKWLNRVGFYGRATGTGTTGVGVILLF
jgi:hypothetical protein